MKLLAFPALVLLALSGCSNGGSGTASETASESFVFHELAGADCHIQISPGAGYVVMELEYNSTTNPNAAPPEIFKIELEAPGSNYCIGGVLLNQGTPRMLVVEVGVLGDETTATAKLFGSLVTFKDLAESKHLHPKPSVFPLDMSGSDFDIRIHYAGVRMVIEATKVAGSTCP